MTDKPKRKPENRETAKARHDRFTAANPVLKIYAHKSHHAAIKAYAKTLKNKPTGE